MKDVHSDGVSGVWKEHRSGRLSRREFLRRSGLIAGGSFLALACGPEAATLAPPPALPSAPGQLPGPRPAASVNIDEKDARIEAGPLEFQAKGATFLGYLSRPKTPGPHPGVLVVHENRGLLPHFADVTRRLAVEGYAALAIDLLSRDGGTRAFPDPDQARSALSDIPMERLVGDANAGVAYLQGLANVRRDRVGAIGFCFGGGIVWLMAVRNPDLRAAVPFYGPRPPLAEIPNLQAPVLGIYAGEDTRINEGVAELEEALKQNQKQYKFLTFGGANHGFFNDTGFRHSPRAAGDAWRETLGWLGAHLKAQ